MTGTPAARLAGIATPALLLDRDTLEANLDRMQAKAERLGVALRPHLKTHKCVEIARRQRTIGARGVTVSTLAEASVFAAHGFDDLTWAYPLVPSRIDEVRELASRATLRLVVDSQRALDLLVEAEQPFHVWLKIDCGYHRAGLDPSSNEALQMARRITATRSLHFDGLLTHSGQAYRATSRAELESVAERERTVLVDLAERLRRSGIEVPGVSVGSTPAMAAATDLAGVTEIRPGNYALYDLVQVELGSCSVADCAATVLVSVVSSNSVGGSVIDAGALALSQDLGHSSSEAPRYGRVFADYGRRRLGPISVVGLSQEHGIVDAELEVGTRLRILPNHSCLTVAHFDEFTVVRGDEIVDRWKIWRRREALRP